MPTLLIPQNRFGFYLKLILPEPKSVKQNREVVVIWTNTRFANRPRPIYRYCQIDVAQLYVILRLWKRGELAEILKIVKSLTVVRQERPSYPKKARNKTFKEIRLERAEKQRLARLDEEALVKELQQKRLAKRCKLMLDVLGLDEDNPHWVQWKHPRAPYQVA